MRVIIRMWTSNGYHKDVALMDEKQVHMNYGQMEPKSRHLVPPINAVRLIVDPKQFPEAVEFEVICQE